MLFDTLLSNVIWYPIIQCYLRPYYPMLFATLWSNVICDPMIQRFWYPIIQCYLRPYDPKVLGKGGRSPQCRDAFYHRYPEMGGALCYRLRAYPSVKGPHWTKYFSKILSSLFLEKCFCNPSSKDFRIFIFFCSSFFISSFFEDVERMLSKGFSSKGFW